VTEQNAKTLITAANISAAANKMERQQCMIFIICVKQGKCFNESFLVLDFLHSVPSRNFPDILIFDIS